MTPRKPPDVGPESQLLHGAELQAQIAASQAMLQARQNKPSPAGRLDLASRLVEHASPSERLALLEALDSVSDEDKAAFAIEDQLAAIRAGAKALAAKWRELWETTGHDYEYAFCLTAADELDALLLENSARNTPDTSCGDSPEVLTQIKTE